MGGPHGWGAPLHPGNDSVPRGAISRTQSCAHWQWLPNGCPIVICLVTGLSRSNSALCRVLWNKWDLILFQDSSEWLINISGSDSYFSCFMATDMCNYVQSQESTFWAGISQLNVCISAWSTLQKYPFIITIFKRRQSTLARRQCWQMLFIVLRTKPERLSGSPLVSDQKVPRGSGLAMLGLPGSQRSALFLFWERRLVKLSVSAWVPALVPVSSLGLSFFIQSGQGIGT